MRLNVKNLKYQHGDQDQDLWIGIGPFLVSREVHNDCGGPIYSTAGTTWILAYAGGEVVGFASLRCSKSVSYYDYGYVLPDWRKRGVYTQLADDRTVLAQSLGLPLRTVIRAARWPHYKERGWKKLSVRGQWIHAGKELP